MMISLFFLFLFLNQAYSSISPISSPSSSPSSSVVGFGFDSFQESSCNDGNLICMGSVTSSDDGYLSLTPELLPYLNHTTPGDPQTTVTDKVGRVLYPKPFLAWPSMISTSFTIRITKFPGFPGSGDGMTFIFAPDTNASSPDSYGSSLGLFSTGGLTAKQLAIELDTYKNDFDIDGNHIAIDTTSVSQPIIAKSLNRTGIELNSGRLIKVRIDYDGKMNLLSVYVGYYGVEPKLFLQRPILLSNILPSSVYVGFTASTGAFAESHQVLSWEFSSLPL